MRWAARIIALCLLVFLSLAAAAESLTGKVVKITDGDNNDNTAPRGDKIAIQTNNVEIDDRNFIYLADRANTGLHIVELKGKAKKIIDGDDD